MDRLAQDLSEAGKPLKEFDERYKKYRECMQQVEADPDAPPEIFGLLGRTTARLAIGGAKMTPAGQAVGGFLKGVGVDDEALVEQAGAWAGYLAKKFKNKDEVALVREPVETLTLLFVQGVNEHAEQWPVVLCFDTWEHTGVHLDAWLRDLLERRGLSASVWLVIAGRNLPSDEWEPFYPVMACHELKEFTEEETGEYLKRQGITEEARVQEILDFSGRVPVLVSTLASAKGGSATEAAEGLVDRYLKWVDDEQQRETALSCAAARRLNKDVVEAVMGGDGASELFDWLVSMPFVQSRPNYWEYHPTVRNLMFQYARSRSMKASRSVHASLEAHYQKLLTEKGDEPRYRDEAWHRCKLEAMYHGLMRESAEAIRQGLETFLLALRGYRSLAGETVTTWLQVAEELGGANEVSEWAGELAAMWVAIQEGSWEAVLSRCKVLQTKEDMSAVAIGEVFLIQGIAYVVLQDYERAIEDYGRAIEWNPENAEAYYLRGLAYAVLQDYERAIEDYGRAIERSPENAEAYYLRGLAYIVLQDYERAIGDYGRAIERNPENAETYYLRGLAYAVLQDYERAIEDCGRAIELDPEDAAAYYNRGLAYAELQDYERAIEDYGRAIERNPEDAAAYYNRGLAYAELQDYERAIEDYGRAIERNPENAEAYYSRGNAYAELQDYERAIEDYGRVIELEPEDAAAYYNRGLDYAELQDYERAIEDYGRAIELDPEDAEAYYSRGNAYAILQDYERAIEDYGHAIELDPEFAEAYYNRGLAYAQLQDYGRAIENFGRAIELDPEDAAAYNNRGLTYAELQDYERAIEDYGRAIERNPEYAVAYYLRGFAYAELQNYERAIEDYGRAIERNPEYAKAYYNTACTWALRGNAGEACVWLEQAIELDKRYREDAQEDKDFDGIRGHECFDALVGANQ